MSDLKVECSQIGRGLEVQYLSHVVLRRVKPRLHPVFLDLRAVEAASAGLLAGDRPKGWNTELGEREVIAANEG